MQTHGLGVMAAVLGVVAVACLVAYWIWVEVDERRWRRYERELGRKR